MILDNSFCQIKVMFELIERSREPEKGRKRDGCKGTAGSATVTAATAF
jgi:hypothetical protein